MKLRTTRGLAAVVVVGTTSLLATFPAAPALSGGATATAGAQESTGADDSAEPRLLLNTQHVDALVPVYEDGQLSLTSKVDLASGRAQRVEPADLVFQLKDTPATNVTLPDLPDYAFLGQPGDTVWIAPMVQDPDVLWPGWNTEDPSLTEAFDPAAVDFHLLDVDGPGRLEVYQAGVFGPRRLFSSSDPDFRVHGEPVRRHVHASWAFTALGEYTLTFEATATTVDGEALSTGPVAYTWVVGPVATTTQLSASPEEADVGEDVTLTASVTTEAVPESGQGPGGVVSFRTDGQVIGEAPLIDGVASLVTADLPEGSHEITAGLVPDDETAPVYAGSESASVTVTVEVSAEPGDPDPGDPDPGPGPGGPDPGGPPPECPIEVVLDVGHVDVAARLIDGELRTQIKDDTQGGGIVWRDLESVAFHLKPESQAQVPPGDAFAFLGEPGDTIWQLPQTQDHDLLWPGWNTEAVDYGDLEGGITWSLDGVEGPEDSHLAVYQIGSFGNPIVHFDSSATLPRHLALDHPTHAHGNWAFAAEGFYELAMSHTATLGGGGEISDGGTLAVAVGDVDLGELCPDGDPPPGPGGPGGPGNPGGPGGPGTGGNGGPDRNGGPGDPAQGNRHDSNDSGGTGAPPAAGTQAASGGSGSGSAGAANPCPAPTTTAGSGSGAGAGASPSGSPGSGGSGSGGQGSPGGTSSGETVILDAGHVDYAARVVDGNLRSQIKDDTAPGSVVWRSPEDVVFHVKPEGAIEVPSASAFSFLGQPGDTIWQIPQTQDPDLLWLGWNTEEISSDEVSGRVSWTLDDVTGPGDFALYEFDSFGQPDILLSDDGDSYDIPLGTHAHGNWAFTEEGIYRLTFTHRASLSGGGDDRDTQTVTVAVGDVDPRSALPLGGPSAAGAVTLSAATATSGQANVSGGQTASSGTCASSLPFTGAQIARLVALGALLTAAGAGCVYLARRRRRARSVAPDGSAGPNPEGDGLDRDLVPTA